MGSLYAGCSSPEEIKTYHAYTRTGFPLENSPDSLSYVFGEDEEIVNEEIKWPILEFAPTYPHKPSYSTITIHNFRY